MRYNNYHKHDHYGNPWSTDVIVKVSEYAKRAQELGHTTLFSTNHGVQGNIFDCMESATQAGLKMCYGTESYFVKNRFEKDRSNRHIILIAKNNDGAMQINNILTEAHTTGFYYRPRIDYDLVMSLEPKDVIITTACVAGIWEDNELLMALKSRFGDNFFLELQDHNIDLQKQVNHKLLDFSKIAGIQVIHANDSHYINPSDAEYRNIFLRAKGVLKDSYSDCSVEDGMILDYPDSDVIYERYERQGVLSVAQVTKALENTLVFDECEPITLVNDDIKLPRISQDAQNDLRKIVYMNWDKEKKTIPESKHQKYEEAIEYELDIIDKTDMANYFLIDYWVAKNGQEKYNGRLTNTGRGSAPSFYVTKMLGLTDIDRVDAPITLFPTRFMSVERILGSRSLPDIDLNTTDREPFIKATEDLLGAENCAWMISWKPLQEASAFRLWCKGIGLEIGEYDSVAKDLDSYKEDGKWGEIIRDSQKFVGVVESISESPCSMCLYYKPLRSELGLVRTPKGKICCLLDGYNCDKYKYLKNDYLTVTVWAIIRDTCELAGIPIPTIKEIDSLFDEKTFEIYKNGLTSTINQADSDFATGLVKKYCPQNVSEMSAFVAIIRPGCASLLQDFINRKDYTTGVPELDEILVEGKHRMIYQELIMKYLIWLGIPETGSYDIIKKIAKKKFKDAELKELKNKLLNGWIERVGREEGFTETWTVVEQAAHYSFNASHSLSYAYDSLYGAYLKSHYPLEYYTVALNYYADDSKRTAALTNELQYFGIQLKPIRFRYSRATYTESRDDNSIYKGIASIKDMSTSTADTLYTLRDKHYDSFMEFLYDTKENPDIKQSQIKILASLDYFSEFGDANYLFEQIKAFNKFYGKKQIKKDVLAEMKIPPDMATKCAEKETAKMYSGINSKKFLLSIAPILPYKKRSLYELIDAQATYLGGLNIKDERYKGMGAILDIDTKYSPKLTVYSLKNGSNVACKVDKKTFNKQKLEKGNIIRIISMEKKPKVKRDENGKFVPIEGTTEYWLKKYEVLSNI